jgi:hypothetical protein
MNYLKSAIESRDNYCIVVDMCLTALVRDTFLELPSLQGISVDINLEEAPPYHKTYNIDTAISIDIGCGWVPLYGPYMEAVGKIVHYIYTHAPAVIEVKGVGTLKWLRHYYNV